MPRKRLSCSALPATVLALALLALPGGAEAAVGIRGGLSSGPDQFLIGAHIQTPPVGKDVYIVPSAEAGFGDDAFTLSFNGDLEYRFGSQESARPYVGGGLSYFYVDPDNGESDSDFGLSVLGGVIFERKSGRPIFLEAKLGLADEVPDFKMIVGVTFP